MYYAESGYKTEVKGIEKVGGADAYVLDVTKPSGKTSTEYYDVKTGFLIKQKEVYKQKDGKKPRQQNMQIKSEIFLFLTKQLLLSNTPAGQQEFIITPGNIKLNEPVSADDFK